MPSGCYSKVWDDGLYHVLSWYFWGGVSCEKVIECLLKHMIQIKFKEIVLVFIEDVFKNRHDKKIIKEMILVFI